MTLAKPKWYTLIFNAVGWEKRERMRCFSPPLFYETKTPGFLSAGYNQTALEPDRVYYVRWRQQKVVGNRVYYSFFEVVT
jgi:hypothetical protein